MRRFTLGLVLLLAACVCATAQTWPSRQIRAIIPFGAGSATDVIPRIVFDELAARLGQPIIVENRGGAGGTIGAAAVAKAGGRLRCWSIPPRTRSRRALSQSRLRRGADFTAIGAIGSVPNVLIISPARGLRTIREFVAAAKAKPGSFNFATVGVGSAVHLSAERFRIAAGYEAVHIPFKGGAEALTEVIAGRVEYYFCPIATALPHIRDGRLLALAVSSPQRASALPDVPTTLESGFPDSDYTFWIGVFAPARTPQEIVGKLNREMAAAVAAPAVRDKLALGVSDAGAEFDAHVGRSSRDTDFARPPVEAELGADPSGRIGHAWLFVLSVFAANRCPFAKMLAACRRRAPWNSSTMGGGRNLLPRPRLGCLPCASCF